MDKAILVPSVLIAAILIAIYLFRCWRTGKEANNAVLISLVLNSSGIVCGLALAASPFFPSVKALIGGIDIYIVIGGVAVLFVSGQAIHKDVIKSTVNKSIQSTADAATD
ncbi:threonyl-tRNA synthetase [Photobacterium damselae]|uniref:threonyl-tRNA synthetase n=1 Tax=Photobacterium damselae TaxID=38293 RepID=UPI004068B86F